MAINKKVGQEVKSGRGSWEIKKSNLVIAERGLCAL